MLYCILMMDKRTDSSYNHPHKKNAKNFAKAPCKALDIKPHICTKFTASQLHSFTASQLHSFTAEGYLCPNKTITHNQIFSHKKVCSTDWNNSPKTKSYTGFPKGYPLWQRGYNQRSFKVKRGGHRRRGTTNGVSR